MPLACTASERFKRDANSHTLKNVHPGDYSIRVRATNFADNREYTDAKYFDILCTGVDKGRLVGGGRPLVHLQYIVTCLPKMAIFVTKQYTFSSLFK